MTTQGRSDVYYQIVEHLGVLNKNGNGWSKEINLISWNGGTPKFDIRDWDEDHEHMSKGVTLKSDECKKLLESLLMFNNKNLFREVKAKEEEKRKKWKENNPTHRKKDETVLIDSTDNEQTLDAPLNMDEFQELFTEDNLSSEIQCRADIESKEETSETC